jgi:acyl-CoA hydrolase
MAVDSVEWEEVLYVLQGVSVVLAGFVAKEKLVLAQGESVHFFVAKGDYLCFYAAMEEFENPKVALRFRTSFSFAQVQRL